MEIPDETDDDEVAFYQINIVPTNSVELPAMDQQAAAINLFESDDTDDGFVDYPDEDDDGQFEVFGDGASASSTTVHHQDNPRQHITSVHTDIEREFMHIVIRVGAGLYEYSSQADKEAITFSSTHDGPFSTKWTVHFYPWGHPSGYSLMMPAGFMEEHRSASLYVRLQESPTDMVEARITATVVSSPEKAETVVKTSMDNLMLCPRNKIDEFQRGTSGHGWPKISSVKDLRNYKDCFCLVVTLQIVKPEATFGTTRHRTVFQARPVHQGQIQPRHHLQHSRMYYDAFLQARDWEVLPAHRFILAAGSEYFRRLLAEDQGVPFVCKTDNSVDELAALLDVLYQGKVPARTFEESMKLRDLFHPYGVDSVKPVFFNDVVDYRSGQAEAVHFSALSEESLI